MSKNSFQDAMVTVKTAAMMDALDCTMLVSQGFEHGKKFCVEHGSANDVGYGWKKGQCGYVRKIVRAVYRQDFKTLATLLEYR